ncbi:MAG TPA: hypothetical protein PLK13_14215, partial [Xanthobacteraceae bacterium]|nr:hypothetical protein [Xanthobacteraceae bacterium]
VKSKVYGTMKVNADSIFFVNFTQFVDLYTEEDKWEYDYVKENIIQACDTARKIMIFVHGRAGDSEYSWTYKNSYTYEVAQGKAIAKHQKFLNTGDMAFHLKNVIGEKSHMISLVMCYGARSASGYLEDHTNLNNKDLIKDSFAFKFFQKLCSENESKSYILTARTGMAMTSLGYDNQDVGRIQVMAEVQAMVRAQLEVDEDQADADYHASYAEMSKEEDFRNIDEFIKENIKDREKNVPNALSYSEMAQSIKNKEPKIKDENIAKVYKYLNTKQDVLKSVKEKYFEAKGGKFVFVHIGGSKDIQVYRRYLKGALAKEKVQSLHLYLDGKNIDQIGELAATIPMNG